MYKLFLIALFFIFSNITSGQSIPELKVSFNGIEPIVVEIENATAPELYEKALNWVKETYKNPDRVLKASIQNEKIRIEGFQSNAWKNKMLGVTQVADMNYTMEISFKDGKYRLVYIIDYFTQEGRKINYTNTYFYNKKGEVRTFYPTAIPSLEKTINNQSLSFYNYVSGKTSEMDNDW